GGRMIGSVEGCAREFLCEERNAIRSPNDLVNRVAWYLRLTGNPFDKLRHPCSRQPADEDRRHMRSRRPWRAEGRTEREHGENPSGGGLGNDFPDQFERRWVDP